MNKNCGFGLFQTHICVFILVIMGDPLRSFFKDAQFQIWWSSCTGTRTSSINAATSSVTQIGNKHPITAEAALDRSLFLDELSTEHRLCAGRETFFSRSGWWTVFSLAASAATLNEAPIFISSISFLPSRRPSVERSGQVGLIYSVRQAVRWKQKASDLNPASELFKLYLRQRQDLHHILSALRTICSHTTSSFLHTNYFYWFWTVLRNPAGKPINLLQQ